MIDGFTGKYKCHGMVYFETFTHVIDAIAREKQIKGRRREKKDALVESTNPFWRDLAEDWFVEELLLNRSDKIDTSARSPAATAR